jgi:hypothetical protein
MPISYPAFEVSCVLQTPLTAYFRKDAVEYSVVMTPGKVYYFTGTTDILATVTRQFIGRGYIQYVDRTTYAPDPPPAPVGNAEAWGFDGYSIGPVALGMRRFGLRPFTGYSVA